MESRNELYRELAVLRKTVFRNCGPFLRVSSAGLPQLTNLEFRLLDATRVHPESYRLVRGASREKGGQGPCLGLREDAVEHQLGGQGALR